MKMKSNVESTLFINVEKIKFDDLETQYKIAIGQLELFTDKRKYDEAIAKEEGMARIRGKQIEQIMVKTPKGKQPMFEFDDGKETEDYQKQWIYDEDISYFHNPRGGSAALHKDLFKDVEADILHGLEMCKVKKRTAAEINDLPEKYRTCPNMKIFIEYDITNVPKPQQEACVVLMNLYNKFRKFEMELFKRNYRGESPKRSDFNIMLSFWKGREFERVMIALEFGKPIIAGIKESIGCKLGDERGNKIHRDIWTIILKEWEKIKHIPKTEMKTTAKYIEIAEKVNLHWRSIPRILKKNNIL